MSEAVDRLRDRCVKTAVEGPGKATREARRAAYDNADGAPALIAKVATAAWTVTDEDVSAAKQAGLSEDEIFELVICAAVGQSDRQLEAALALLDEVAAK